MGALRILMDFYASSPPPSSFVHLLRKHAAIAYAASLACAVHSARNFCTFMLHHAAFSAFNLCLEDVALGCDFGMLRCLLATAYRTYPRIYHRRLV